MQKRHYTEDEARDTAAKIGIDWDNVNFDLQQFTAGMSVETEHGTHDPETNVTNDDPTITGKIAWAHLKEIKDYYDRLDLMERSAEK
jgi:hypothetical protein